MAVESKKVWLLNQTTWSFDAKYVIDEAFCSQDYGENAQNVPLHWARWMYRSNILIGKPKNVQ